MKRKEDVDDLSLTLADLDRRAEERLAIFLEKEAKIERDFLEQALIDSQL